MAHRAGTIFRTADAAAIAAIEDINATSIAQNFEYAGRILTRSSGFTFTPPQTLKLRDDSYAGQKTPDSIGTYHTHSGEFEPTDEIFSINDKGKATLGKEYSYLGTPRGRILKYTPVDLLDGFDEMFNSSGLVETLRYPSYNPAQTRGAMLGRWAIERPQTSDAWDEIFFADGMVVWTQGSGPDKFLSLGTGLWWTQNDTISVMWRADLVENWPLPLRQKKEIAEESDGARLIAKKIESSALNPKSRFSLFA
jgi:Domain of unknown function (DUF4329)